MWYCRTALLAPSAATVTDCHLASSGTPTLTESAAEVSHQGVPVGPDFQQPPMFLPLSNPVLHHQCGSPFFLLNLPSNIMCVLELCLFLQPKENRMTLRAANKQEGCKSEHRLAFFNL